MTSNTWRLPATARSVPDARRLVRETLAGWGLRDVLDTAMLLTSEVVTNAVLHARTEFDLLVDQLDGDRVRIEVTDGSPMPPTMRRHSATASTGRGLQLLDMLADRWSVEPAGGGKTVWFVVSGDHDGSPMAGRARMAGA
jgi:anti-sigma regulatory factor (Ser/Thr protein kinase)